MCLVRNVLGASLFTQASLHISKREREESRGGNAETVKGRVRPSAES